MYLKASILGLLCIALTTSSLEAQDFRSLGTRRGAVTGAIIGGLIGGKNDEVAAGIIAGGLIGGVTGRAIGNRMDANSYGYGNQGHTYQQSYGHNNHQGYGHRQHIVQQQHIGQQQYYGQQVYRQPQQYIQPSHSFGGQVNQYGHSQGGFTQQQYIQPTLQPSHGHNTIQQGLIGTGHNVPGAHSVLTNRGW